MPRNFAVPLYNNFLWILKTVFFLKLFYFLTLQYCIGFAIYQHESATGLHVFPILNPPPSPYHPSESSQCTSKNILCDSQWRISATALHTPRLGLYIDHRLARNASQLSCQGNAGTIPAHSFSPGAAPRCRWAPKSIKSGDTATHGPRERINHLGAKGWGKYCHESDCLLSTLQAKTLYRLN